MNRFLIFICLIIGFKPVFGQYRERIGELDAGIRFGLGHNYLGSSFTNHPKLKVGLSTGMMLRYFHTEQIALTSGLSYELKGGRYTTMTLDNNQWTEYNFNQNLEYFEIPIGLAYYLSNWKFDKMPYVQVEFYYAFLAKAKEKELSIDNSSKFIDKDYGFNFRIGMSKDQLNTGITYKLGITNLTTNQEEGKLINHRPEVYLTYFF